LHAIEQLEPVLLNGQGIGFEAQLREIRGVDFPRNCRQTQASN
jgi:hypothetical protein